MPDPLSVGETAPDFELRGIESGETATYRLSDYTDDGEWVMVNFYSFDFNPICTEGMCALRDAEFFEVYDDLSLLGISGDGIHAHERFADQHGIRYPLLSDTGRDVADAYGLLQSEYDGMRKVHQRAVFIVDDDRTVQFVATVDVESPDDIDLDPINEALQELRG